MAAAPSIASLQRACIPHTDVPQDFRRRAHGDRIVGTHIRSLSPENRDHPKGRRFSNVVGTGLEGQTEDGDANAVGDREMSASGAHHSLGCVSFVSRTALSSCAPDACSPRPIGSGLGHPWGSNCRRSRNRPSDRRRLPGVTRLPSGPIGADPFVRMTAPSTSTTSTSGRRRAQIADLVREGDQRGEQRVRRVLDHLGGAWVRANLR